MTLRKEIEFFNDKIDELKKDHSGEWVLIHDQAIIDFFRSFESAAMAAIQKLGEKEYLIRQIDAPPTVLPFIVVHDLECAGHMPRTVPILRRARRHWNAMVLHFL